MKRYSSKRTSRRRQGGGRFFLLALATAVVIFVVVWIVNGFVGRHTQKTAANKTPSSVTQLMPTSAETLAGFELFMSRCKRSPACPYYALSMKGNTLRYVGVRNVAEQGTVTEPLTPQRKRALLTLVQKAAFFTLADSYDLGDSGCKTTDTGAPTLTIGVALNGETKVVKVNQACSHIPPRLVALARGIDRVVRSARWTGVRTTAPATGS